MLDTVLELAFVAVAVDPGVDAVAVSFAEFPLSDIGVSLGAFPHP